MTELMYLQHPDLFETSVTITGKGSDTKGSYLVLDRSLFYPQGGGQPADQGRILLGEDAYNVYDVRNTDGKVRHYVDLINLDDIQTDSINIVIDKEHRNINTRYHTAGHLIAAVAEGLAPKIIATKGHHIPGEAYVEFNGTVSDVDNFIEQLKATIDIQINSPTSVKTEHLNAEQADILSKDLPYALPKNKSLRVCHIQGFAPVPCGGTHVRNLKEIGLIIIHKCKCEKGKTKISYGIKA